MMKHCHTIFLVVLTTICASQNSSAQELNVIAGGGNYAQGATHSLAWTMGEVITRTLVFPNNHVTQGFHQSDIHVLSVTNYEQLDIAVYPNPARDMVNVRSSGNSKMTIYTLQGKLIDVMDINSITSQIDVSYLSRGAYTLVFEANGALVKRMKIVIH